ncbi:hypothetical protein BP6252_07076 [Coleophoma cylindrospora]|uniref:AB hydrolase-1 domain-containing protein n=1 Tax=Coleophoma cylindrospora TaxID=1849047 RepID=A0A3D8RGJ4_9HELO|nr:hypothetical protein BP6252_07076 [Coleophoma cylindrospora]
MSAGVFTIREHVVACEHATRAEEVQLVKLAVKQYLPKDNPAPRVGDLTIIGAHANGLVKELYEPFWEEIVLGLERKGRRVRSIWIADVSNQGASGLINDALKYSGDPIFAPSATIQLGTMLAKGTLRRRVEWPTREAAQERSQKTFAGWDPRVLDRWNKYALYTPKEKQHLPGPPTRLVTSRFAELIAFISPTFIYDGKTDSDKIAWTDDVLLGHKLLELIARNTLYICGDLSVSAGPEIRQDWLARTATGPNLGRRVTKKRVETAVIPRAGHYVPLEDPKACADAAIAWLMDELQGWDEEEKKIKLSWKDLSPEEKEERAETWMTNLKAKI